MKTNGMWMKRAAMVACALAANLAFADDAIVYGDSYQAPNGGGDNLVEFEAALKANPCPKDEVASEPGTYTFDAKGELGVTKGEGTIALRFDVDKPIYNITYASVDINAYDVDYPIDYSNPEHDVVYFNGKKIGRLTGVNNGWRRNTFSVNGSIIKTPSAAGEKMSNSLDIHVDIGDGNWITQIGQATLTIKGELRGFDAPKNFKATDLEFFLHPLGVYLSWDAVNGAKGYNLYKDSTGQGDWKYLATTKSTFYLDLPSIGQTYFAANYRVAVAGGADVSAKANNTILATHEDVSDYAEDYGEWASSKDEPRIIEIRSGSSKAYTIWETEIEGNRRIDLIMIFNDFSDQYEIESLTVTATRKNPNRARIITSHDTFGFERFDAPKEKRYSVVLDIPSEDSHGEYDLSYELKYKKKMFFGLWSSSNTKTGQISGKTIKIYFDKNHQNNGSIADTCGIKLEHNGDFPNWVRYWNMAMDGAVPDFTREIIYDAEMNNNREGNPDPDNNTRGQHLLGKIWIGPKTADSKYESVADKNFDGIDAVANTIVHESGHKKWHEIRKSIYGSAVYKTGYYTASDGKKKARWNKQDWETTYDSDGDGLPDKYGDGRSTGYDNTTLGGGWRLDPNHRDTNNYASRFGAGNNYEGYADEEVDVRWGARDAHGSKDNDWSLGGEHDDGTYKGNWKNLHGEPLVNATSILNRDTSAEEYDIEQSRSYRCDSLPDYVTNPTDYPTLDGIQIIKIESNPTYEQNKISRLSVCLTVLAQEDASYHFNSYFCTESGTPVANVCKWADLAANNTTNVELYIAGEMLSENNEGVFLKTITIKRQYDDALTSYYSTKGVFSAVYHATDFVVPTFKVHTASIQAAVFDNCLNVTAEIERRDSSDTNISVDVLLFNGNEVITSTTETNSVANGEISNIAASFPCTELHRQNFTDANLGVFIKVLTNNVVVASGYASNVLQNCSYDYFRPTNAVCIFNRQSFTNDSIVADKTAIRIPCEIECLSEEEIYGKIYAVLVDTNNTIASELSFDRLFAPGKNEINLDFATDSIVTNGMTGPFVLSTISVIPHKDGTVQDEFTPAYQTKNYTTGDFSRKPIALILDPVSSCCKGGMLTIDVPVVLDNPADIALSMTLTDSTGKIFAIATGTEEPATIGTNTVQVSVAIKDMIGKDGCFPLSVSAATMSVNGSESTTRVFDGTGTLVIDSLFAGLPFNGLSYQIDASDVDMVRTSANGRVAQWLTTDAYHVFVPSDGLMPQYLPTAFNGKGAIRFGYDAIGGTNASTRMVTDSALDHQTVFIVCRPTESQNSYAGLWGEDESIFGINLSSSAVLKNGFVKNGDLYLNGKHCDDNASFTVGEPLIITAVNDELQTFDVALGNIHNSTNYPLRYFKGELAEIIAYNRKLSAAERKQVETHLKKKWITGVDEVAFAQEDTLVSSVAQEFNVDVVAASEWHLSSDQDWITPNAILGTNTTSIALNIAANTTGANRTAILTLSNDVSVATLKLVQYKDGYLEKSINFLPPVTISGAADVKTEGTLVYAFGVGNAVAVNGVSFQSGNSADAGCFSFGNVSWYGGNYGANTTAPWGNLPSAYRTLLTSAFCCRTVYMNNLEVGQPYMVQIWANNSTSNGVGRTMVVESGFNSRTLKTNSTDAYGGIGQYVVGYFVADGTQKSFTMGGGDCFFNAIQLRKVASVPAASVKVTDSVAPAEDRVVPFGDVSVGLDKTEHVTIENASTTSPLTVEAISTCYAENFDKGTAEGWEFDNAASWRVEKGQLNASNASRTGFMAATYGAATFSDVAVQMDCWRDGDSGNSCGLFLRASPDCGDSGSGYEFFISVNGSYSVWRSVRGTTSSLQGWTSSGAIVAGTNTLLACAQGENLSFYINGKLVWAGKDAEIKSGRIGVGGYTTTSVPTTYWFDNFIQDAPIPLDDVENIDTTASNWKGHTPVAAPKDFTPAESEILSQRDVRLNADIGQGVFSVVDSPSLPYVIPCGGMLSMGIRFAPVGFGSVCSSLRIRTDDAQNGEVNVSLSGRGTKDSIRLIPDTGFRFIGTLGGAFAPESMAYAVTNASDAACEWAIVEIPEWLSASSLAGTVAPYASEDIVLSPNAQAEALDKGVYYGTVAISNKTTTLVTSRIGTLEVRQSAALAISPDTIVVTNRMGETKTVPVTISNAPGADIPLTATIDAYETGRDIRQGTLRQSATPMKSPAMPDRGEFHLPPGIEFRDSEVLLKFAGGEENASAQDDILSAIGGAKIIRRYKLVPGLVLARIPEATASSEEMEALVQRINGMRGIAYAHPNYAQKAIAIPNDELFDQLWAMRNSGQTGGTPGCDISAVEAWNKSTGNNSVIVGVIDSGVDYTHEDLKDNMWVNEGEIPDDGIDNDGNGVIDDVYGYNAIDDTGDPMDDHKHGTHCAGTIAATGNNGLGVAGVCWSAKIMALKFLDSTGHGDTANALSCIEYAVSHGAKILSNSWGGGGYSYALKEMIDAAGEQGVLFVAAAGNESSDNDESPSYPCGYACENIISVMSTDHNDKRSTFSNYGRNSVHIGAPGTGILSCRIGGGYMTLSGTSMATPHVSGAAALLLSVNQSLTPVQIKELLMNSGDPVLEGQCVSGRRLNIGRALNMSEVWLSVDKTRMDDIAPGASDVLAVKFAAGFADAGVYDGVVAIVSNDQNAPVTNVNVRMVVVPDELRISPNSSSEISGEEGGSFSTGIVTYTLTNDGEDSIEWGIEAEDGVSNVSQTAGTLAPGASRNVAIAFDAEWLCDLPAGVHTYQVLFRNLTSGVTQRRLVNVTVKNVSGTLYVDATRPDDSGSGRSWRNAKRTLQAAVAKAMDGSVIVVTNGIYGPIETTDVKMEIRSVNGPSVTSIDGRHARRCATLGYESWQNGKYEYSTNVVLSGFTLLNGDASNETTGKLNGGGAYCGILTNCIVFANTARNGGGVYGCRVMRSRLADNRASSYGGAAYYSTLDGCLIDGNTAGNGAGTYYGETYNSVYSGNRANSYGGGAYYGIQIGCTIVGNSTAYGGGGTYYSSITNTIVWGNWRSASKNVSNCDGGRAAYSCIEAPDTYYNSRISTGTGCITSDPLFVDSSKSVLTLASGSPCLGKGLNSAAIGSGDASGERRIKDGTVDIGAYEGVRTGHLVTTTVEGPGLTSAPFMFVESGGTATLAAIEVGREFQHWEVDGAVVSTSPVHTLTNVRGNIAAKAVFRRRDLFVDAASLDDTQSGFSWDCAKRTINAAVASAFAGETIWVANGVYECVSTEGKEVVVRSVNGAAATVIDGANTNRCAMLGSSSGSNVVGGGTKLCGFALINGYTTGSGAGAYYGSIENCEIRNCNAVMNGGGTYYTVATNCVIANNKALNNGGGMFYGTSGNCSIVGNKAGASGGGTYYGTHANSVIYANTLTSGADANSTEGAMTYCCTYPSRSGTDMIFDDPRLVDPYNGDARLRVGSPCINAGLNDYACLDYDIALNDRVQDGRVDIGAYEGNPVEGFVISGRVLGEGGLSSMTAVLHAGGSAAFTAMPGSRDLLYFLTNGVFATSESTFVWENVDSDGIITAVFETLALFVDARQENDQGDGLSWNTAKKTIQSAIDCAIDGDTILVARGVYEPVVSDNKCIIIKGVSGPADTIIDGDDSRCCATLGSYSSHRDTWLEGFTIRNGRYSSGGGVRYGTLSNCVVTANLATGASYAYGGGTYYSTLYDCVVSNNVVAGSYDSSGGGMYYGTAYNCLVVGNIARGEYAYGGGADSSTLHGCRVIANTADGERYSYGGGTYYGVQNDCWYDGNTSSSEMWGYGGGAYYGTSSNCTYTANSACGNTNGYGGAVCYGTHYDCGITNNYATTYGGGVSGGIYYRTSVVKNEAKWGGGCYSATFYDGEVMRNTASQGGGTDYGRIYRSTISHNRTTSDGGGAYRSNLTDCLVTYNQSGGNGGGALLTDYSATRTVFRNNIARGSGGGVYGGTCNDCGFTNNTATSNGGGAYNVTANGSSFAGNSAAAGGGIYNGTYSSCTVEGNSSSGEGGGAYGGTFYDSLISGNNASGAGGGLRGGTHWRCRVIGNRSTSEGGGVYSGTGYNSLIVGNYGLGNGGGTSGGYNYNCTITENWCGGSGGGTSGGYQYNTIVWGNTNPDGANNTSGGSFYSCRTADPSFANPGDGDYRLRSGSPCINAGNNSYANGSTDLALATRIQSGTVDIGAYEGGVSGFVVAVDSVGSGTLEYDPTIVADGGSFAIDAQSTGREFLHFLTNGVVATTSPSLSLDDITADVKVTAVFAHEMFVDAASGADANDGLSWATAKKSIQAAIDVSVEGDTIWVADGVYEPITTNDRRIDIVGVNGAEKTIIDGRGAVCCAYLGSDYQFSNNSRLSGFTLRNGFSGYGGGVKYGRVDNCVIENCRAATNGGGVDYSNLSNCVVRYNSAQASGGGLTIGSWRRAVNCQFIGNAARENGGGAQGGAVFRNCEFAGNIAGGNGGAIYNGTAYDSTFTGNRAAAGGATYNGTFYRCTLAGNTSTGEGGGAYGGTFYDSVISNNVASSAGGGLRGSTFHRTHVVGNKASGEGGGVYSGTGYNSIIARNASDSNGGGTSGGNNYNCTITENYCAFNGGGTQSGYQYNSIIWNNCNGHKRLEGRMNNCNGGSIYNCHTSDPKFVNAAEGDYRLRAGSPCLNAGNASYVNGSLDVARRTRVQDGTVDIGAHEGAVDGFVVNVVLNGGAIASHSSSVVVNNGTFTVHEVGGPRPFVGILTNGVIASSSVPFTLTGITSDIELTVECVHDLYVDAWLGDDANGGFTRDSAKRGIQAAIAISLNGDTIHVADGWYEPFSSGNRAITIRSDNGPGNCFVDGDFSSRCATLGDSPTEVLTTIEGLTLCNGYASSGGGCRYGTVVNCVIEDCYSTGDGGGAYDSLLRDCTLAGNVAVSNGGGAYGDRVKALNCAFFDNISYGSGGGVYCGAAIDGVFEGNIAYSNGGAAYGCWMQRCVLHDNQAANGGGTYNGTMYNCLYYDNYATSSAGAAYNGTLYNCTLTRNKAAGTTGGMYYSTAYNTISYGNRLNNGSGHDYYGGSFYNCCLTGSSGNNSVFSDPLFFDPANDDFRLSMNSPCLNKGSNSYMSDSVDLAGKPRTQDGTVDIGCYEGPVKIWQINVVVCGKGRVDGSGTSVFDGGELSFRAVEDDSPFLGFHTNGVFATSEKDFTWRGISTNGTLEAWFKQDYYVDAAMPDDSGDGLTWETARKDLSAVVAETSNGANIWVRGGTYAPIASRNKRIFITAVDGRASTVISGGGTTQCANLAEATGVIGAQTNTVLVGFTLRDGFAANGGGSYGGTLLNCLLCGNFASNAGGGSYYGILNNCTLSGNTASSRGGGACGGTLNNCIVWGNTASASNAVYGSSCRYSCLDIADSGEGNICADPLFEDAAAADYRLQPDSPCIDAGLSSYVNCGTDIDGNPRVVGAAVDMGAYEFPLAPGSQFEMTLDRQGGSGGTEAVTVTYGAPMPDIAVPARTGYDFGGYFTSTNGLGTQYYTATGAGARNCKTTVTTLYAMWTPVTCAVTLNSQGGLGGTEAVTATYGAAMPAITVPTRTGHAFGGYFSKANGGGTQYYSASGESVSDWDVPGEATLYAKWTVNKYVISLDAHGGVGGTASVTATYGAPMPDIAVPVREGFSFGGYWTGTGGRGTQYYTASGAGSRNCELVEAITLHAKWNAETQLQNGETYVDAACGDDANDGLSWATAKATIQAAIDIAPDGAVIFVSAGAYPPIATTGQRLLIEAIDGAGATSIDASLAGASSRCATLGTTTNTVLSGFTLKNGHAENGGGAYYGTLEGCVLTNNVATKYGGGAYASTLRRCTVADNRASASSTGRGGGAYGGTLEWCHVRGNSAKYQGGGTYGSTLRNCLVTGNTTTYSAGLGGGTSGGTAYNCTICGNRSGTGGGTNGGIIYNSVVWGNTATRVSSCANTTNTTCHAVCTTPMPEKGDANMDIDPLFADAASGDYSLSTNSPCIDAGLDAYATGEADLGGNRRIVGAAVDMGAYEFQGLPGSIPDLADATAGSVAKAISTAGFADEAAVIEAIGGDAAKYSEFKAWAQTVPGGEEAVVASPHAAVSWLLGSETLFASEPEIEMTDIGFSETGTANRSELSPCLNVTVVVRDGDDAAMVSADKLATMFEATSDLGDWDGAAKLEPIVSEATRGSDGTLHFTVYLGDNSANGAFLRIKVKP